MAPMSIRDCLVSRYTVPRKLRGMDSCTNSNAGVEGRDVQDDDGFTEVGVSLAVGV